LKKSGLRNSVELDLTLARGLNYYTGAILEVKAAEAQMGSICGGGRYDNLTGVFGLDGVSGVGVSFGADRIYDVMTQLNLFEKMGISSTEVLVLNFGEKETLYCLQIVKELRRNDIKTELYPDVVKLKKQMSYANAKGIPYVIMAGEEEINNNQVTIKNMDDGQQYKVNAVDVSEWILNNKN
ncbi:MAG: ATP phosphoribosyltransferase regulatory subunit, partial [Bacteroidales bacterium]|nr:ATP phosphoribosyltransferase regulatory subunit [Bacteroidales bacterium]